MAIERTGTIALSADGAETLAHSTRRVLATVDGVDTPTSWTRLLEADFGAASAIVMRRWFTDQAGAAQGNAEVIAWEPPVLAEFG